MMVKSQGINRKGESAICVERIVYYKTHPFTWIINKGNNKITELRAILQRESQNS
jgi:hypothetical protein